MLDRLLARFRRHPPHDAPAPVDPARMVLDPYSARRQEIAPQPSPSSYTRRDDDPPARDESGPDIVSTIIASEIASDFSSPGSDPTPSFDSGGGSFGGGGSDSNW
jgi:uncharacterized membrane protein YgcG